jgi:hypothetical protein
MPEPTEPLAPAVIFAEDRLPSLPSELLATAVADARKTLRLQKSVTFAMSLWLNRDRGRCAVCLAGNMLLRRYPEMPETISLTVNPKLTMIQVVNKSPQAINQKLCNKLDSLDLLRRGELDEAAGSMSEYGLITDEMSVAMEKLMDLPVTQLATRLSRQLIGECPAPSKVLVRYLNALEDLAHELQKVGC